MPMLGAMKEVLGNYKKNNLAGSWVSEKTPQISEAIYQIEHMVNLFACYAKTDKNDEIPLSRWITRKNNKISLHVSPISASKGLSRTVWPKCYSMIGLSATASLEGKFDRILNNCGLSVGSKVINIESPFNYQRQVFLQFPIIRNHPNDRDENFITETAHWLNENLIKHKSNLVLFSSWKGLTETVSKIKIEGIELLVQGTDSKTKLIERHKAYIDEGKRSVILATQGFYEGVDLAGDYLTHVVITKIPFDSPVEPNSQTLNEYYKAIGRNTFNEISLPNAKTKMIQACGRLIRTENDIGVISILDNRLKTKSYGRSIINAMPDFKIAN
jgi:ATP-dependent DNA helicase DinG